MTCIYYYVNVSLKTKNSNKTIICKFVWFVTARKPPNNVIHAWWTNFLLSLRADDDAKVSVRGLPNSLVRWLKNTDFAIIQGATKTLPYSTLRVPRYNITSAMMIFFFSFFSYFVGFIWEKKKRKEKIFRKKVCFKRYSIV